MLQARVINSYPKNGRKMFVFKVTGTDEEKQQYLDIQKKRFPSGNWTDDDGEPLYWSSAPGGAVINLKITVNDNVVEDTTALDLTAASKARHDHVYDSVRAQLASQQGGMRIQTPAAQPASESGGGLDS